MSKHPNEEFADWWNEVGSGIMPLPNHDAEDHARRIGCIAWEVATARLAWNNPSPFDVKEEK